MQGCVHYWKIRAREGGELTSLGVCEHCGETREFPNTVDYSIFTGVVETYVPGTQPSRLVQWKHKKEAVKV